MNKVFLMGRLTATPDVRRTQEGVAVSRFTLAINRMFKREGEPEADFLRCVAFGRLGEVVEQYLDKGMKIAIDGHIQTGSYVNSEGSTVYTTDIVIEGFEFAESKKASGEYVSGNCKKTPTMKVSQRGYHG